MGGQGSLTHFPHGVSSFGIPLVGSSDYTTTGNVFFVDSGSTARGDSAAKGSSPDTPFATVDFAVGRCTANNGDIIFVMPGHNESFSGADSVAVDVAGVSIIGMGKGADKPTFDFDNTAGELVISAANVYLENLRFRVSESVKSPC